MDHIIKGKAQVHLGKCDYFILKNLQAKDYVMFMWNSIYFWTVSIPLKSVIKCMESMNLWRFI